jgi:Hydrolase of X-linked nucleoside diphosphate N terminal
MNPTWLDWTQRLLAVAQTGLTYAADPYDIERYKQIRAIAAEIATAHSDAEFEHISWRNYNGQAFSIHHRFFA